MARGLTEVRCPRRQHLQTGRWLTARDHFNVNARDPKATQEAIRFAAKQVVFLNPQGKIF